MQDYRRDPNSSNYNPNVDPQPLISLGPLVKTLWQRKTLIGLIAAIFIALTVLYISITPSTYTAKGVIVIDPRQARVLDSDSVLSGIGANSAAISSQVEIIQSRTLVQKVFEQNGYSSDPEFSKPRFLKRIFSFIYTPEPASKAQAFANFWRRLNVERQGLTYILSVKFKSQNAQKSADIVNAVIAEYLGSQVNEKSDANAQVSVQLSGQVEGLRDELAKAEARIELFKNSHNILSIGSGGTLLQREIEQLSTQLVAAKERARNASDRNIQVSSINTNSASLPRLFEILDSEPAEQLRSDYNRASIQLSSLQARLGPRHPSLRVAKTEISRLEKLIRSEAQTMLTRISNRSDLAAANVRNTENALFQLSAQNAQSNQDEVRLHQLERQAGATRRVLEQLTNRAKETNQLEYLQRSDSRVISRAEPPISATWPKGLLLLAVSTFFGLSLGGATALYLGPVNQSKPKKAPVDLPEPRAKKHPVSPISSIPISAEGYQTQFVTNLHRNTILPAPAKPQQESQSPPIRHAREALESVA